MVWSLKRNCCTKCKTTLIPHAGHGLCRNCYTRNNEKGSFSNNKTGKTIGLSKKITKELLEELYVQKELSLQDIAKIFGCNRQNIQYWKRKYKIGGRNKSEARKIALKENKIIQKIESKNFQGTPAINIKCNTSFFKTWSKEMSYVLGIIYSDGNLSLGKEHGNNKTRNTSSVLSISQKDPEILEKIKNLIATNAKLYLRPRRVYNGIVSGKTYSIRLSIKEIVDDLISLGLEPNKSMTMDFPEVPKEFQRHFIRGLWDGDGSIRNLNKKAKKEYWRCDYVCGSLKFLNGMINIFHKVNIKNIRIYNRPNANAHDIIIEKNEIPSLFKYMYKGVDKNIYYSKKHELFSKATKYILLNN
ncbi:hypothetical protein N9C41_01310 [Candidatus Marinimicrobia bacterium]|nr:hypothetical protein [Candidatus Neomarinimicrobiota bacterium]